jgi:hypothetical protein
MSRVAIVGEVNPYGADPQFALYPDPPQSAGSRMQRLVAALDRRTYICGLARYNLCVGRWSVPEAREAARQLREDPLTEVVVLLGRKVAGVFWAGSPPPPFSAAPLVRRLDRASPTITAVMLPHPSGLCRVWNEPDAFDRARQLLRAAAPEIPWGNAA